jgi:hypothetical protein
MLAIACTVDELESKLEVSVQLSAELGYEVMP